MNPITLFPTLAASLVAIVAAALASPLRAADSGPPPNIVFLLADDLGYSDVGFMGSKDYKTPNIDKLAHEGAILDAHYVQPVCSPTRAALMTGRYATHTGVYTIVRPHLHWGLPLQERTLANALKDAGYETALTGKWHLGEFEPAYTPTMRGFDHQYGHYFGAIDYFTHIRDGSHDWYRDGKELHEEGYSTNLIAHEACRLVKERDKAKPLFLYVPFNGVHAPLESPESYMQPYAALKENRRTLGGMLAAVDEAIGQIVATLEETGMRKNTLIIFSSDNGGPGPGNISMNGDLRAGKGTIYEGGVRVCACVNWPGHIEAGIHIKEPMHAVDWFPTLVTLAGGTLEQKLPLDGRDVWPMLTQGAKSPHDAILLVSNPPTCAAIRMGDWKLLMNASTASLDEGEKAPKAAKGKGKGKGKEANPGAANGEVQLYNLANDIGETTDLATKEPERAATLRAKLEEFLKNAVPPGNAGLTPYVKPAAKGEDKGKKAEAEK
jgi:arylsulfatase A-like enzyme